MWNYVLWNGPNVSTAKGSHVSVSVLDGFRAVKSLSLQAVPRLRRFLSRLSPDKSGFDSRYVHVRFVVDKVVLGHVFRRFCEITKSDC